MSLEEARNRDVLKQPLSEDFPDGVPFAIRCDFVGRQYQRVTMGYREISEMETCLEADYIAEHPAKGYHESCLRAYHILEKVKWLLSRHTDLEAIAELIEFMENAPKTSTAPAPAVKLAQSSRTPGDL